MRRVFAGLALSAVALSGCYHVTVETGLPAGTETIEKPWALGFIGGLIPPATIETAAKCKNGVAKVETQMSFLNWLVSAITYTIISPMDVKVTCAASNKMGAVPVGAPKIDVAATESKSLEEAMTLAAKLSADIGQAVYVQR
jgi:hypothetical protein